MKQRRLEMYAFFGWTAVDDDGIESIIEVDDPVKKQHRLMWYSTREAAMEDRQMAVKHTRLTGHLVRLVRFERQHEEYLPDSIMGSVL